MRTTAARKFLAPSPPGALREAVQLLQRVFRYRTCHLDIEDGDPKNRRFGPACCTRLGSAPPLVRIAFQRLRIGVMLMRLFDSWAPSDPPCCGSFVKRWLQASAGFAV